MTKGRDTDGNLQRWHVVHLLGICWSSSYASIAHTFHPGRDPLPDSAQLTIRPHPDINRAGFSDLTQTKGADYVITAADVEQVNAAARQKLANGLMNSD